MRSVFLDVLLCRKTAAWVTSRAAIDRFLKTLAERYEKMPQPAA